MSGAVAAVDTPRTYLAFDFGVRRVGVASGNTLTRSATPLTTIATQGNARDASVAALVHAWCPTALVVGMPFHPDGAAHANTARARRFARELAARHGLVVHEVDERWTTTESAARGDADLDAGAAAVILEQFLAGDAA